MDERDSSTDDASAPLPALFTFRREEAEDGGERRVTVSSPRLWDSLGKRKRGTVLVSAGLGSEKTEEN